MNLLVIKLFYICEWKWSEKTNGVGKADERKTQKERKRGEEEKEKKEKDKGREGWGE